MRPARVLLWGTLFIAACRGGDAPGAVDGDDGGGGEGGQTVSLECTRDAEGHAVCAAKRGKGFYCGKGHVCTQATPCEEEGCCVPGENGDAYCKQAFGECGACEDERCSTRLCPSPGCTPSNVDHLDCVRRLGDEYVCMPDGTCEKGGPCEEEDCCTPGEEGDAYCHARQVCSRCAPNWRCGPPACGGP